MNDDLKINDLDNLVLAYRQAEIEYNEAKAISSDKYKTVCDLEARILDFMTRAGKSKYFVEQVGTVSVSNILRFTVPKDLTQKRKFMTWLKARHGEDGLLGQLTFNSNTLNGFLRREFDAAAEKQDMTFQIPGIDSPTHESRLSIRKS